MKVMPRSATEFLTKPDARGIAAVLIYGPDTGQVRERANLVRKVLLGDVDDPFSSIELTEEQLKSEPALLVDELGSISLLGGRRVITLRDGTDKLAKTIESCVDTLDATQCYLIIAAGDLGKRSGLRSLFESKDKLAALACYKDEEADIASLMRQRFEKEGIVAQREALHYLMQQLGNDRMVTRSEMDKIILYLGDEKTLSLQQAEQLVGHNKDVVTDVICNALASGNTALVETQVSQAFREGIQSIMLLRMTQRHFQRLYQAQLWMSQDRLAADAAMAKLRPPIFFRYKDSFRQQLHRWSESSLLAALSRMNEAELACKQTGAQPEIICHRSLLAISAMGSRLRGAA